MHLDCPSWSWYECRGQSRHFDSSLYIVPAGQSAKNRRNNVYAPRRISTYVRLAEKMVEKLKEISVVFFFTFLCAI